MAGLTQAQIMAEAYRRGMLDARTRAVYEEGARRGMVNDPYAAARAAENQGGLNAVHGASLNLQSAIPGFREIGAGMAAGAGAIDNMVHGKPADLGGEWNRARALQQGLQDQFAADHPIGAGMLKGAGYAGQAGLALATGGESEAPAAIAAARAAAPQVVKRSALSGVNAFAGQAPRMAVTGGTLGAVNAASQPGTLQQRAQAADNAFLPGAAAGVAFPAAIGSAGAALRTTGNALRAVGAVGSEAVDAASRAMTGKTIVDQARPIPANVALAGQSNALGTLRSLGATPEGLLAAQQAAGGKPITTAEALGPQGISQASGLIRRAGTAAQTADATMAARAADRGNRILGDIHATTGVDPEAAKGNVDAIVQAGRAKADPLFEAIRSRAEPISHPGLSQILSRPVVAKAVGAASDDLLNAGIDPQAHGFVMGSPIARGPDPLPTPGPGDVARALADVKEVRTTPTGGLFRAMQELGGVKVKAADGSSVAGPDVLGALNGVRAPGLINNQAGMSPENMAQALHDRGFFGENVTDPSSAFADALAEHARGNPVFKPGTVAADAAQRAQGLDQEMQTAGVLASDRPAVAAQKLATHRFGDTQESAAIQDEGGPGDSYGALFDQLSAPRIQVSGLTPHALDLVRQNLGDMVERDPFGKVIPDSISRGNFNINQAKGALTDLLAGDGTSDSPGLIPGYREALDTSGDYQSVKGAYDRTQGRLFGTSGGANDPRAFDGYFKGLSPAE